MLGRVQRHLLSTAAPPGPPAPMGTAAFVASTRTRRRAAAALSGTVVEHESTMTAPASVPIKKEQEEDAVAATVVKGMTVPIKKEAAADQDGQGVAKRRRVKIELELEGAESPLKRPPPSPTAASSWADAEVKPESKLKSARKSPSPTKAALAPRPPPARWHETLDAIRAMRRQETAPVDVVGCALLASRTEGDKVFRFQTLVALMLSSQTKDPVTAQAMANLQKHGLTVPGLIAMSPQTLDSLIGKVGFHNRKTMYARARVRARQVLLRASWYRLPGSRPRALD